MARETATVTSIHDLADRIRDASPPGAGPDPERVRDILGEALATPGDWIDPAYQQLGEGDYALYPVYRAEDGRCSMLVVALRPGTPLPVHNHGSWAVIGVYQGREHETWFRRVDDGSIPGHARLEVDQTFVNERGTAGVVPDGRIHTVEAIDGRRAVSIHVYGTDIVTQQRSEFDPDRRTMRDRDESTGHRFGTAGIRSRSFIGYCGPSRPSRPPIAARLLPDASNGMRSLSRMTPARSALLG